MPVKLVLPAPKLPSPSVRRRRTVPDPAAAQQITRQLHAIAPSTPIVTRARYHRYIPDLLGAAATVTIDEETEVGLRIAAQLRECDV